MGLTRKKYLIRSQIFYIVFVKGKKKINLGFFPDGNLKSCVILPAMSCPRSHTGLRNRYFINSACAWHCGEEMRALHQDQRESEGVQLACGKL